MQGFRPFSSISALENVPPLYTSQTSDKETILQGPSNSGNLISGINLSLLICLNRIKGLFDFRIFC